MSRILIESLRASPRFRVAEFVGGLIFIIIAVNIFFIPTVVEMHGSLSFLDSIIISVVILMFASPAIFGVILVISGMDAGNPAFFIRYNLQKVINKQIDNSIGEGLWDSKLLQIVFLFSLMIAIASILIKIKPYGLYIDDKVSFGDVFTPISIVVSGAAIYYAWRNSQEQGRREYEDVIRREKREYAAKIRNAAGSTMAIMARRRPLNQRFFEDIEPLILDSTSILMNYAGYEQARDYIFNGIIRAGASISQRRLDEPLEDAYKELYGYDPKLQMAYNEVLLNLRDIESYVYQLSLFFFQRELFHARSDRLGNLMILIEKDNVLEPYKIVEKSGFVTNLRMINSMLSYLQTDLEYGVAKRFSELLETIVGANDDEIAKKRSYVSCWDDIPGNDSLRLKKFLVKKYNIDWVETAKIKKFEEKVIQVCTENNSLFLVLNSERSEVILIIDDGRIYKFISDNENGKLNISKDLSLDPPTNRWIDSFQGLKYTYGEKFTDAIESYNKAQSSAALKKGDCPLAPLSGRSLAYLGNYEIEEWYKSYNEALNAREKQ